MRLIFSMILSTDYSRLAFTVNIPFDYTGLLMHMWEYFVAFMFLSSEIFSLLHATDGHLK